MSSEKREPTEGIIEVWADFNGLFSQLLCLTHKDYCLDAAGNQVPMKAGMMVRAFMEDTDDDGAPDDLVATGVVERSPDWLACRGSRWVLRIDENGVRHRSEVKKD
jgi:hypothetical protein